MSIVASPWRWGWRCFGCTIEWSRVSPPLCSIFTESVCCVCTLEWSPWNSLTPTTTRWSCQQTSGLEGGKLDLSQLGLGYQLAPGSSLPWWRHHYVTDVTLMETSLVSLICLWGWVHTRQWRCTMLYSTVSCLDPEWSKDMKIMELTYTNSDKKLNGLQGYLPLPLYSLYRVIIARELKHNRHHNYFPHTDIIYPLPIIFCASMSRAQGAACTGWNIMSKIQTKNRRFEQKKSGKWETGEFKFHLDLDNIFKSIFYTKHLFFCQ